MMSEGGGGEGREMEEGVGRDEGFEGRLGGRHGTGRGVMVVGVSFGS